MLNAASQSSRHRRSFSQDQNILGRTYMSAHLCAQAHAHARSSSARRLQSPFGARRQARARAYSRTNQFYSLPATRLIRI